jgi:hypothetical protein
MFLSAVVAVESGVITLISSTAPQARSRNSPTATSKKRAASLLFRITETTIAAVIPAFGNIFLICFLLQYPGMIFFDGHLMDAVKWQAR